MPLLTIRLNKDEMDALQKWEKKNGLVGKRSVIVRTIIRGIVNEDPELLPHQISAFKQTSNQLRAIGRNLNQITRSINQNPGNLYKLTDRKITELYAHVDEVASALSDLYGQSKKRKMAVISKVMEAAKNE